MMRTWKISLCYPDGATMFIGTVRAEEVTETPKPAPAATQNGSGGEKMTEPQRRYLFRLLASQKVEGKAAEEHLRKYFGVERLADITKAAASEYIDQLARDRASVS